MKSLIASFFCGLLMAASSVLLAQEYVIHFSHVTSPDTPKGKAADKFAELINQRLAGQVRVKVYPNSQLYDDNLILDAMRMSTSPTHGLMGAPSLSKFVEFSKTLQVFDIPFLFNGIEDIHKLVDSPTADKLTKSLEGQGLKGLGFWDNGMRMFSIRGSQPLTDAQNDFKNKEFRIQNSKVNAAMVRQLGGVPHKLPFKETYAALAQGVVAGQENTWSNIYTQKFHHVQDYITLSKHAYLGYLVVVSQKFWQNLPKTIRLELLRTLKEVTILNRHYALKADERDRQKVISTEKARIVSLTHEEIQQWKKVLSPIEAEFRNEIGADLLQEIHQVLGY